jgi:hypothetical protein
MPGARPNGIGDWGFADTMQDWGKVWVSIHGTCNNEPSTTAMDVEIQHNSTETKPWQG